MFFNEYRCCLFYSVLKSIEFSSSATDEVDGDVGKTKSLEILLLEKNKVLQSENTQLKVNSNDISGKSHDTVASMSHDLCHKSWEILCFESKKGGWKIPLRILCMS